jgi:hypothetical protein
MGCLVVMAVGALGLWVWIGALPLKPFEWLAGFLTGKVGSISSSTSSSIIDYWIKELMSGFYFFGASTFTYSGALLYLFSSGENPPPNLKVL